MNGAQNDGARRWAATASANAIRQVVEFRPAKAGM
jgi:hypothetical protein